MLSVPVCMGCDRVAEVDDPLGERVELMIGGVECQGRMCGLGAVDQEVDLALGERVAGVDPGLDFEEPRKVLAILVADQEGDGG